MKTITLTAAIAMLAGGAALAQTADMSPMIDASDQSVSNGVVSAAKVVAPANGWLVVHRTDSEMKPGPVVGYAPVREGETSDVAAILTEEHANAPFSCVMHCYSSGPDLAITALDLGFYLSMSGIATFPRSKEVRDIFAAAPLDRILVETDSPYLAPPPYRGKRNEPAYTAFTAQVGADVFGVSLEEFAARSTANFERLFTKAAAWRAQAA